MHFIKNPSESTFNWLMQHAMGVMTCVEIVILPLKGMKPLYYPSKTLVR